MPDFRWSAVNPGGDVVHGLMEAPDRSAVVERLQRQGQVVLRADPAGGRGGWADLLRIELGGNRGLDKAGLSEATRELAIMLAAGQDLDRALRFVVENTRDARARAILGNVRDKVRSGSSLAAALAAEPRSFSKLYIGLVRAGEAGGTLPATLDRLASLLERERSLSANLRSALIYPALLIVAAIGSIVLLLDYVLPQFAPIFEQAGAELPAATRALMTIGTLVGAAAPWLLVALFAAGLIVRQLLARPAYRLKFDRLLLRLPVAGGLLRETLAARLTRTLGSLLQNGVALIPALGIAKDALGNLAAADAVEAAATGAKGGGGLARPLAAAGLFPARTIHLLQLGEEAAQLSSMALKAADIHDEQARLMMQRLVALAVPMITIAMGLAVAGIVSALLTAMLSLNDLAV
ncbi:MAG: type II secretion system F family protein [Alphaproteobacteria bacterium]|nr:type II secretion system F family protein [Alphaproteobacteria bacterium]MBV9202429.1 type II secretion system F family protein [Alphaproteobacteria bacterium]MBV9376713.1 type II secretion system F family protein [Alphaproteobacteria bacterium]MBV9815433.1 type II secretion system F family protein [Alphaproteobacteria bacterium]